MALTGQSFWELEIKPGEGHNYYYIMEALYRYHLNNPDVKADEYFENTLNKFANCCTSEIETVYFLNILMAELDYGKKNVSPFKINVLNILKTFRNNLMENSKMNQNVDLIHKIEDYDKFISKEYGYKIL